MSRRNYFIISLEDPVRYNTNDVTALGPFEASVKHKMFRYDMPLWAKSLDWYKIGMNKENNEVCWTPDCLMALTATHFAFIRRKVIPRWTRLSSQPKRWLRRSPRCLARYIHIRLQWHPAYSDSSGKSHVTKKCHCKHMSAESDTFPLSRGCHWNQGCV